jgi:hypothetical protein
MNLIYEKPLISFIIELKSSIKEIPIDLKKEKRIDHYG